MGYRQEGAYSNIELIDDLCYQVLNDIQQTYDYDMNKILNGKDCEEEALKYVDNIIYNRQDIWNILEALDIENIEIPVEDGCKTIRELAVYYAYAEILKVINFDGVFDELENDTLRDNI